MTSRTSPWLSAATEADSSTTSSQGKGGQDYETIYQLRTYYVTCNKIVQAWPNMSSLSFIRTSVLIAVE